MTDDDVLVSALLYRPTEVENAYVFMMTDSAWVLHTGSQYFAVNKKRSHAISKDTTLAQAKAMVL